MFYRIRIKYNITINRNWTAVLKEKLNKKGARELSPFLALSRMVPCLSTRPSYLLSPLSRRNVNLIGALFLANIDQFSNAGKSQFIMDLSIF